MNIKIVKQEIKLKSWGLKLWIVDIESWKHKHLDHKQKTWNQDHEGQNHQPRHAKPWIFNVESKEHEHQNHQLKTLYQDHED